MLLIFLRHFETGIDLNRPAFLWNLIDMGLNRSEDWFAFWQGLGFGQLIEVGYNDLLDSLKS